MKITRVLDANPGEPEKLDFIEGFVGNAKAARCAVRAKRDLVSAE